MSETCCSSVEVSCLGMRRRTRHALCQLFPELADLRLAQNLQVMKISLLDLNSALSSGAPPHLRIIRCNKTAVSAA